MGAYDIRSFKINIGGSNPAAPASNVALYKKATATSSAQVYEGPQFAVDNSIAPYSGGNSKWCCTTSGDKWLALDLGQSYNLNRWVVYHAGAGGENTAWNTSAFKLQKSADNSTWTDVDPVTGNTANITDRNVTQFTARYVRLYITNTGSDGAARIYEFQVYGTPAGTPTQVSLSSYYNQDGFSYDSNRADGAYDPGTSPTACYSADLLNSNSTYYGISYALGPKTDGSKNEIYGTGQTITLSQGQYSTISFLGSASNGDQTGTFTIKYSDGTTSTVSVTEKDWCTSTTTGQNLVQAMGTGTKVPLTRILIPLCLVTT